VPDANIHDGVGVFDFLKRKKPAEPSDPLKAYDGMIESLERQAAQVRRSAATLLALKGELSRDHERYGNRMKQAEARVAEAGEKGDARAERALRRDHEEAKELFEQTQKALDSANDDSRVLLETAEGLAKRARELKAERMSAQARFKTGQAVSTALQQQADQFDRVMAIDAARDEIERARALADIYREEAEKKR
jgi:phage shock protein A